ncbi:hypothetical protein M5D96_012583 [Drosophila gunungcola]|uniref:Uncharacterized protein n=1 Tax=Drosophila gunungcola TaxID=103775 RepID=A0A9P9YCX6_9MUSC|nr:hypothetical protein M5D96_012583 [Drosophila gunungcola]
MGKKFCYSELQAATQTTQRIANGRSYGQISQDQLEKNPNAEMEDEGDGSMECPKKSTQMNVMLGNLAHGYLKLADQIQAQLCPPPSTPSPPPVDQVEEKREVGGEILQDTQAKEEISESSEENSEPCIGFVDLFWRSLHFERWTFPSLPWNFSPWNASEGKNRRLELSAAFDLTTHQ